MNSTRLTDAEIARLPLYVQEEVYRLAIKLEGVVKAARLLRGRKPEDDEVATISCDLEHRQELPLDGLVRWQFGRTWSNSIDVRRGLVDRRTIKVNSAGGRLVVLPYAGNAVVLRLENF